MKKRNLIFFLLAGAVLAVSFALPGAVLAMRDAAIESGSQVVTMDEAELSLLSPLTPEEKLKLAGDASAVSIPLEDGVVMDRPSVEHAAMKAARELEPHADWTCEEPEPYMAVGGDGSSIVLWRAVLTTSSRTLRLLLDDETGAILGLGLSESPAQKDQTLTSPSREDPAGSIGEPLPSDDALYDELRSDQIAYLAAYLLEPLGLEPERLTRDASGILIRVTESDLTLRLTVSGGDGLDIRLNMN